MVRNYSHDAPQDKALRRKHIDSTTARLKRLEAIGRTNADVEWLLKTVIAAKMAQS